MTGSAAPRERGHHHFTVDLEEYFHVSALEPWVSRRDWTSMESRAEGSACELLDLLDDCGAQATFFILGWLATRRPGLVRRIAARGHEVASHGWAHRKVTDLDPDGFRRSVAHSKAVLEDLVGTEVVGYRAPSFSIVPGREWALDVLLEEGYRYDSSVFPVRRPGYGYPGAPRVPHRISRPGGALAEFPPATLETPLWTIPAGGGAYLRFFPVSLIAAALRDLESRGAAGTIYVHPWELDPDQPRLDVPWITRTRHYTGLRRTAEKLRRLLTAFRFIPVRSSLASVRSEERAVPLPARAGGLRGRRSNPPRIPAWQLRAPKPSTVP